MANVPVKGSVPVVPVAVRTGAKMLCTSVALAVTVVVLTVAVPAATSVASLVGSPDGERREAIRFVT